MRLLMKSVTHFLKTGILKLNYIIEVMIKLMNRRKAFSWHGKLTRLYDRSKTSFATGHAASELKSFIKKETSWNSV